MIIKVGQMWRWVGGDWAPMYTQGKTYAVQDVYEDDEGRQIARMEDDSVGGHTWPVGANFYVNFDPVNRETDIKVELADEAKRIVTGARRSAYGTPESNFERISALWSAHLVNVGVLTKGAKGVSPLDVSLMMALMKIARLAESPGHYDSYVDLVGYALTGAEVAGAKKDAVEG